MKNDYSTQLRDQLIAIMKDHPKDLKHILHQVDGAFPSEIIPILKSLEVAYPEISEILTNKIGDFENASNVGDDRTCWIKSNLVKLSKAHPADYDWRFTSDTVQKLSTLIVQNYSVKSIGLFGVTTLYMVLSHFNPEIELYLVNKSSSLIKDLRQLGYKGHLINHDLFKPLAEMLSLDLIVADPPWYNDFYKAFILRASQSLRNEGYMMLSVLPKLTRPNAEEDIAFIDQFCKECGFIKVEIKTKFLIYETPDFEKKSLDENLLEVSNWRYGDLVIYKKVNQILPTISESFADPDPVWMEFILNDKKIKIRKLNNDQSAFDYKYVANHKVLPSVSRRYENRDQINFWTSDNIAFNVTNLAPLKAFFSHIENGEKIKTALQNAALELDLNEYELLTLNSLLQDAELI